MSSTNLYINKKMKIVYRGLCLFILMSGLLRLNEVCSLPQSQNTQQHQTHRLNTNRNLSDFSAVRQPQQHQQQQQPQHHHHHHYPHHHRNHQQPQQQHQHQQLQAHPIRHHHGNMKHHPSNDIASYNRLPVNQRQSHASTKKNWDTAAVASATSAPLFDQSKWLTTRGPYEQQYRHNSNLTRTPKKHSLSTPHRQIVNNYPSNNRGMSVPRINNNNKYHSIDKSYNRNRNNNNKKNAFIEPVTINYFREMHAESTPKSLLEIFNVSLGTKPFLDAIKDFGTDRFSSRQIQRDEPLVSTSNHRRNNDYNNNNNNDDNDNYDETTTTTTTTTTKPKEMPKRSLQVHSSENQHIDEHNRLEEGTLTEYKVKTLGTAQAAKQSAHTYRNQSRYHEANRQLAHEHSLRVQTQARCRLPKERIISISSIRNETDAKYMPHCTILHRCGDDTGCCDSDSMTCMPLYIEQVELFFWVERVSKDGKMFRIIEGILFDNHTICHCVEKSKLHTTNAIIRPRCLECPTHLKSIYNDRNECSCECAENDNRCKGEEHFSSKDRICLRSATCELPKCEFGAYDSINGQCPKNNTELAVGHSVDLETDSINNL